MAPTPPPPPPPAIVEKAPPTRMPAPSSMTSTTMSGYLLTLSGMIPPPDSDFRKPSLGERQRVNLYRSRGGKRRR